jgi:hypothetical protein
MHVLQWIAVQAEDKDEAYRRVEDNLNSTLGDFDSPHNTWYDWFVVGGGRWNTEEGDSLTEAYAEGKTNLIVSAKDTPDEFDERVLQAMESRKAEFDNYAKDIDPNTITKIINDYNPREFDFFKFQGMYPIKRLIDMAYGNWSYDSYFFDMENDTTTPKYLFEAIDIDPTGWFLVPTDFHF